ncbi:hypothetical protein GP475_06790 [Corynebacterium poyangense]|uniref:Uncharacterized protein n=1 Tax=Corynebacterium poyangense TaxID=2684405 RepID=A0A7H0SPA0_9CORY|nr:hypothetical protein [Corynebacterium poyangense]MBZ8177948.1 hypothetical protein [Corynebacterium poyangense]QNQ90375.1 hypothetical protein GP475_06790 [Corynebacterium poyangense]
MTIAQKPCILGRNFHASRPSFKGQVWDPPTMSKDSEHGDNVRTLSVMNRTYKRDYGIAGTQGNSGNGSRNYQVRRTNVLNFILGGVFGLSLLGGFLFLDSVDDLHSNSYGTQAVSHVPADH